MAAVSSEVTLLGSECAKYGLTSSDILGGRVKEIPNVTNQLILELLRFKDATPSCSYRMLFDWLKMIYGSRWPHENAPTLAAVTKSIERLKRQHDKLKKKRDSKAKRVEISDFLQEVYVLPKLGLCRGILRQFAPPRAPTIDKSSQKVMELRQKLYAVTRNTGKRLKRQESIIRDQKKVIKQHEKKLNQTSVQLTVLRKKLNAVNHRVGYWKKQAGEMQKLYSTQNKQLQGEIKLLKEKINSLDLELSETIESTIDTTIKTFEGGKYTDDVQACVYELLSLNVGVRNVAPVIRCVLSSLAHKSVDRLPSYGLTCQMILESLAVVQAQLGEALSETHGYTTLQSDGTTKYGQHYAALDVQDSSTTYSLGLRQVFSGSSVDTLETLKEILHDVDAVQLQLGKKAVSSKIVMKIKNTMSDRHAAEKAFNELLHDFRADILPTIAENWSNMTDEEKEQLTRINNFFCGLHYLVGLADSAEEALKQWEAQCFNDTVTSSGTQRLVRTACKAFHHRGSQQSGCSASFHTYLQRHGIHKVPLAAFIGNRFNILFYDAAGVYYLKNHMIEYIESAHGQQANRLLQSVLDDLKQSVYISGCRALGLIDKVVTGPLWRKLEESNISVLDMGSYYTEMKARFDSWSTDSRAFVEGTACITSDIPIHKDDVWSALVANNDVTDIMTLEALQILFSSFSITTQRLLIDHLPDGIYSSFNNDLREEVASVPTTNVAPERDFAMLDRLLREKPNATTIALESMILYSHNKTSNWLDQKASEEKEILHKAVRTLAPVIRKKFKERREEIEARAAAALEKKQEEIQRKHLQAVKEKEMLTKEIEKLRLWTCRADVTNGLAQFSRKRDKLQALKLQIKFRDKVLNQTHSDRSLFRFSHKGKQHTVVQLTENLCQLLGDSGALSSDQEDTSPSLEMIMIQPELLIGRRIKHRFNIDKKLVWFDGRVTKMDKDTGLFEVIYEEDEVCQFDLLEDVENGDLQVF